MMRTRVLAAVLVAVAVAMGVGCTGSGTGLARVDVTAESWVANASGFAFTVDGRTRVVEGPVDGKDGRIAFELPSVRAGTVTIAVTAYDQQRCVIGEGSTKVEVPAGKKSARVELMLSMVPRRCPDAGAEDGPRSGDSSSGLDAPVGSEDGPRSAGADAPGAVLDAHAVAPSDGDRPLRDGEACTSARQCASGHCTDGVCCDSACQGRCQACNVTDRLGVCSAVTGTPVGDRPACSGQGVCAGRCDGKNLTDCAYPDRATECRPAKCASDIATPKGVCDGRGACSEPASVSCEGLGCDPGGTSCSGGCSEASPCPAGKYCESGRCFEKLAQGKPCTDRGQCGSGHCVGGVCCDRACSGECESCFEPGKVGTCTLKAVGTSCRAEAGPCDVAELCDGSSGSCPSDARRSAGTVCRTKADVCDAEESCDGTAATCPRDQLAAATVVCRAAAGPCDTEERCTGASPACPPDALRPQGAPCGASASCSQATFTPSGSCSGSSPACASPVAKNCSPYACSSSGCLASCSSNANCASGYVCAGTVCVLGKADGTVCSSGAECQSGACVTLFMDSDGDGFTTAQSAKFCTRAPAGSTYRAGSAALDCCDSDAAAHPNQKTMQPRERMGCGGGDFNCDGKTVYSNRNPTITSCGGIDSFGVCSMTLGAMVGCGQVFDACDDCAQQTQYGCECDGGPYRITMSCL